MFDVPIFLPPNHYENAFYVTENEKYLIFRFYKNNIIKKKIPSYINFLENI